MIKNDQKTELKKSFNQSIKNQKNDQKSKKWSRNDQEMMVERTCANASIASSTVW